MAKNQDYAQELGRAWAQHRQGQNDTAISEFNTLLKTAPNNADALYGLGLAQRSNKQVEAAQASFTQCLAQVDALRKEYPHEDRYLMLQKMTRQRLDELTVGKH